jgi:hypothetical protein
LSFISHLELDALLDRGLSFRLLAVLAEIHRVHRRAPPPDPATTEPQWWQ